MLYFIVYVCVPCIQSIYVYPLFRAMGNNDVALNKNSLFVYCLLFAIIFLLACSLSPMTSIVSSINDHHDYSFCHCLLLFFFLRTSPVTSNTDKEFVTLFTTLRAINVHVNLFTLTKTPGEEPSGYLQ